MRRFLVYFLTCTVAAAATGTGLYLWDRSDPADKIFAAYDAGQRYGALTITYPLTETLFPPEIVPPTFRWQDRQASDTWLVTITWADVPDRLQALCEDTQWTPSDEQWAAIRGQSVERPAEVTIVGVRRTACESILSAATTTIRTSADPVAASILFREVNLPFVDAVKDPTRIRWRFGNIASNDPAPIVLGNLPVCANCHSFSADGQVMGMDVDYANDKGSYAVMPVAPEMVLDKSKIFTWSDYNRQDGLRTLGMLSQVSPDGRYIVSTAKDRSVFVPKDDLAFSQLFFPIKGILVIYDRESKRFQPLPGADDKEYVQSNPSWSPDGKYIVFARHKAYRLKDGSGHDVADDRVLLRPDECRDFLDGREQFLFDLYRVPFHDGRGGAAEPLVGASHNGMSNYFPRYSPDGKWIVFCQAKTFMLLQPDSELFIVPAEGGQSRRLRCNTSRMNSWHSWSPNGKWLVFSSKANSAYTELFLTHIDEQGNSTPPVLLSQFSSSDRAANIPEFVNLPPDGIQAIREQFVDDASYFRAGRSRSREGQHELAVKAYEQAFQLNPHIQGIHELWGVSLFHLGRLEEAKAQFVAAIRVEPKSTSARCNLSSILVQLNQRDEALKCLRETVEVDPAAAVPRFQLGTLLFESGTLAEAETQLAEAVRLAPSHVEARYNLAATLCRVGKWDQAVVHFRYLVDQQPDLLPALLSLASIRASSEDMSLRDGQEAVVLANKCCEVTHYQHAEALDILGMAHAQQGHFPEAVSAAQDALRVAHDAGDRSLTRAIQGRLRLYQQQRPYREGLADK